MYMVMQRETTNYILHCIYLYIDRLIDVRAQDFEAAIVTPGGTLCLAPTGKPLWSLLKGRFETVFVWFWFKAWKVLDDCFCPAQA